MKEVAVKMLGKPRSYNHAIVRVMLVVGALSGLMSNTAVVALFVKVVKHWAKELKISPSKLLIPLSYASNIGGTLLLIGTPTNLLIANSYSDRTGEEVSVFCHAYRFDAQPSCLCTWRLSVHRFYTYRCANEHYYSRCQYHYFYTFVSASLMIININIIVQDIIFVG